MKLQKSFLVIFILGTALMISTSLQAHDSDHLFDSVEEIKEHLKDPCHKQRVLDAWRLHESPEENKQTFSLVSHPRAAMVRG